MSEKKGFFQGLREGLSANMEMLSAFCEPDCDALQPVLQCYTIGAEIL